jgi:hypothetical protein
VLLQNKKKNAFSVLGISSEFLNVCDVEKDRYFHMKLTNKLVSDRRFLDNNVEKVYSDIMVIMNVRHLELSIQEDHNHTHTMYIIYGS